MPDGPVQPDVSAMLQAVRKGDAEASDRLFVAVHAELQRLARAIFQGRRAGHTLQPTALVNEAWIKLAGGMDRIEGRHHFFALAAKAMRHVLADHARGRARQKRGGGAARVTLVEEAVGANASEFDLIAFNDALDKLTELDERVARVAELRVLGALSFEEAADVLSVSERTVLRDWKVARLWLQRELRGA